MEYWIIIVVTLVGAGLTLFSGFGLGTLLMPVFGLFFPIEVAIGLTAIVHFANNLIKLGFFYKHIDRATLFRFGAPSVVAAFAGAYLLTALSHLDPLLNYTIGLHFFAVTPIKLTIAVLLTAFSLIELVPKLSQMQFDRKYLPVGGLLSGFFGGLSGNQGALRSAFLIRAGLTKETFIATGVAIACVVDVTRLSIYSENILNQIDDSQIALLVVAVFSAFVGVYLGNKLFQKVTLQAVQTIVAIMLLVFAVLLGGGII